MEAAVATVGRAAVTVAEAKNWSALEPLVAERTPTVANTPQAKAKPTIVVSLFADII